MWPSIRSKDSTGLQCFVDFLQQFSVAAKEVGGLSILDDAHHLKKIVDKLSVWINHRWNRKVVQTKIAWKRYPTFREFVMFLLILDIEVEIVTDPVFGDEAATPRSTAPQSKKTNHCFDSKTDEPCKFCSKPKHNILDCGEFSKIPLGE
ncbi:myosin XVIIIAa [Elysia marginata]|uniref:Myosin XVIIIAa n=1 Tax=Elysia marginata TaxID=1093978 RepID=A0AAV4F530_9GAST|nr:myosin XVIIIAa [Elysia marginata]